MKTILQLTILTIALLTIIPDSNGQPSRVKEYGIGLYGLNNFSLQYRWGTDTKLYRITANIGAANVSTEDNSITNNYLYDPPLTYTISKTTTPVNFSVGAAFSIIHLRPVNEKFGFMYGPNVGVFYSYRTSKTEFTEYTTVASSERTTTMTPTSIQFSAGLVLGGYYKFNDSFRIYTEITPGIYYNIFSSTTISHLAGSSGVQNSQTDRSRNSLGLSGLSNNFANITFAYRITYPAN